MRPNSNARTPATDFVQDYAAKRQAQLARAKKIREERLHNQEPNSGGGGLRNDFIDNGNEIGAFSSGAAAAPLSKVPSLSSNVSAQPRGSRGVSATAGSGHVLQVVEEDFKQATQSGIITPDQARQLWAMLSNQIIRIEPDNSTVNTTKTVSVNSLLALSHHSCSSHSSGSGGGGAAAAAAAGNAFGASISLESLRQSIAQFKAQQRSMAGGGGSSGQQQASKGVYSGRHNVPSAAAVGPRHPSSGRSYENDNEGEDTREQAFSPVGMAGGVVAVKKPSAAAGMARRGNGKPEWNNDSNFAHKDTPVGGVVDAHAMREAEATQRHGYQPSKPAAAAAAAEKPSVVKKAPAKVRPPSKQQQQQPSPPASRTGGGGPVSLDDMPVGRGNGGGMSNWDNAYPSGGAPHASPSSFGGGGAVLSAEEMNRAIESEAAAAAKEPLKECNTCGRSFRRSLLPRHEQLCKKQSVKPRKAFNMKAQRLEGVEGIQEVALSNRYGGGAGGSGGRKQQQQQSSGAAGKMPKWKVQHEQFQAAMRAVQQQNKAEANGANAYGVGQKLPPPPAPLPAELDDRVPCPHCGRKFAEDVAARHIPKCATTIAKPKGIRPIRR